MDGTVDRGRLDRRIGARSVAKMLGDWRPPDRGGLTGALADRVRLLVFDGRLPLQTRMPAERELAGALGVSRTTVAAAYEALRAAGVLHSRRGAGSWTQLNAQVPVGPGTPFSPNGTDAGVDLAHASLGAPLAATRAAAAAAAGDLDALLSGHGYDLLGRPELRAAIAARFTARGVATRPDQVLVTSGAQHAFALVLAALAGPGDRVLIEHPTYPNALDALRSRGLRPVPVPMGPGPLGTGAWDLDLLTASVRDAAPQLMYLIPDFHNPTGGLLDEAGRERLVALARRTGTLLVVDETLTELALDVAAPHPAAAFGGADSAHVLTIGSASKIFWGGLRVGWIRAPAPVVRRLAAARAALDLGGPVLEQLVVTRLLAEIDAVVADRQTELRAAREHLLRRLATAFPSWRPSRPIGGLSLWIDLGAPVSSRLTMAARRHDVLLAAGPRFGLDGAFERYLRLPYTLRRDRADLALDRLATAWGALEGTGAVAEGDPAAVA